MPGDNSFYIDFERMYPKQIVIRRPIGIYNYSHHKVIMLKKGSKENLKTIIKDLNRNFEKDLNLDYMSSNNYQRLESVIYSYRTFLIGYIRTLYANPQTKVNINFHIDFNVHNRMQYLNIRAYDEKDGKNILFSETNNG